MFEELFELTIDGAFASKDEFNEFTKEASNEEIFSVLKEGAFSDFNDFNSLYSLKKKEEFQPTSQEVVTESTTTTEAQDGSSDSLEENNTITQAKESVRLFDEETKRLLEANEGATEDELQAIFNREGAPPEEVYSLINIDEQSNQEKVDANERVERLDSIGYIENNLESFDTKGVSEFDKKRLSAKEKSYNIKNPDTGAFELKKESEIDDNLLEDINIYDKATSESRFNIIDNSIVNKNRESIESVPVDIEDSVFLDTDINKSDYAKWEAENIRKGNSAYKFFKNILKSEDEEEFFKQERQVEKLQAYEVSNLNDIRKDLERIDALRKIKSDEAALKDLNNQERVLATKFQKTLETMSKIPDSFELYKKEKLDNELSRRKKIYNASREGVLSESAVELENITKAAGSALISFSTEFFAGIPGFFDHRFTQAGFDEKGILAGLSEMISDPGKAVETSYGAVSRSGFQQGKPVTYKGDEYIVNDNGTVFDKKTNVSVDGIIPESEIQKIKQRSTDVTNEVINWNGGATVQGLTSTLVNLVGLIKAGGKTKNVLNLKGKNAGKIGMGLASFTSSVMGNVDDVRSELMASGMNENEAVDVAITAGSAIATLDGIFSSLAGDNAKLLSGFQAIKDQIKNLAIKEGKSITKKQLIDKGKELVKENVKEFTIEELPVYFSEKGINYLVNQSVGKDVLDDKIRKSEILETAVMTIGATTLTGSRKLLTGNSRSDLVRTVARNVDNLQETVDNLVNEGLITKDQGLSTYNEIYNMQQAELKTKGTVIMSDNMEEASDLLSQRDKLVEQGRDLQGPLREDIDKRISDVDEQLRSLKERDLKQAKEEIKKTTIDEKVEEVTPVEETTVNITPETSSNYANMTEDSDGNFVFFHSGNKGYETVKPMSGESKATSREEAAALSKVGGMAMYYTSDRDTERQGADDAKYVVKIPKGKVYDFNNDTNNYLEEAERRHKEEHPGKAFDRNTQLAYVTKIAGENGFDMVVSEWAGKTRAQTTKELTPSDVKEKNGATITKQFSETYVDNKEKGFESVVPTTMSEMLSGVYDKIYKERNKTNTYDDLYFLAEKNADYTQDEITKLVNESDISQEIKDEYNTVVETIIEPRRSKKVNIKDDYTSNEIDRLKSLPTESENGATMNLDGSKYENGGLVLPVASVNMKVSDLTVEAVDNLIKENSESIGSDNVKVGIYKFPNSDNASIDINIVADRSMRSEALKIGKELGQESLFDLDTFENIKTGADGKNPKKLTPKEFLEIQDRLKPKEEAVTEQTTEAQKIKEIMSVDVSSQVENAKEALSKVAPDVEIILHESEQAYAEATGETGRKQKTSGTYEQTVVDGKVKKVIHINPNRANKKTVAHETFHAILVNMVKTDAEAQRISAAMIKAVYKNAPADLKKLIDDFATSKNSDGSNNYDLAVQNEEKLAELIGYLAAEYDSLPKPTKNVIKRWLDRLAKMFGLKPFTDSEVIDVLNTIAKKVSTGEAITEQDVAILNGSVSGVINVKSRKQESVLTSFTLKRFPTNPNIKLLEDVPLSDFNEKKSNLLESDRMTGAFIADAQNNPVFKFFGGIYFPQITGKWWASRNLAKANSIAKDMNANRDKDGYVYATPIIMKPNSHMSNQDMFETVWEFMKFDLRSKSNKVTKKLFHKYLNKALTLKSVNLNEADLNIKKSDNVEVMITKLNNVLIGKEVDNPNYDSTNPESIDNPKKIIEESNLSFDKRKAIIKGILGDPKVTEERKFPTAGSISEVASKFEEEKTKKATKLWDIVMLMRTKGTLSAKVTLKSDEFYHKSYPAEISSDQEIEVFFLDGAYNIDTTYPVLTKSSGNTFSWKEYSEKHPSAAFALSQYGRTAKMSKASGDIVAPTTKSSKQQIRIEDIIDKLKSNGISDAGVIKYLEEQGFENGAKEVAKYNKADNAPTVEEIRKRSEKNIADRTKKKSVKEASRLVREKLLDRQTRIKDLLKGISSKKALNAMAKLVTKAGANGYANFRFEKADKKIFKGLSVSDRNILDEIIYATRIIAINENRRKKGEKTYKGIDGYNDISAKRDLDNMRQKLGDKKFEDLVAKSKEYFKVFDESLKRMLEARIISEEVYNQLKDLEYSPIKTIKYTLPENVSSEELDRVAAMTGVNSDAIKSLTDENQNDIIMDSRWLLMTNLSMIEAKIFENKMLNSFSEAIESATAEEKQALNEIVLDNPIIGNYKNGKPKRKYDEKYDSINYTKVFYNKDGNQEYMVISNPYARQLLDVKSKPGVVEKIIPKLTGTSILRFFATSGNPLFIVGNTAVDFQNILFLSDVYSKNKFIGGAKLAADFIKEFSSKLMKTDRYNKVYEEYMIHGGSIDYLSVDGLKALEGFSSKNKLKNISVDAMKKVGNFMSYLGETSEISFRLAVYEKSKENQIKKFKKENNREPNKEEMSDIMFEATREARETIDFSQGGSATKAADKTLPYLNAATQGLRKGIDYANENPKGFASSMIQVSLMAGSMMATSLYLLMRNMDDEEEVLKVLDSISDYEKSNYFIIFTGEKDEDGEYEYRRVKKLPLISVFATLAEQLVIKSVLKSRNIDYDVNGEVMNKALKSAAPIVPTPKEFLQRNPLLSSVITYTTNYDMFYDKPVFEKPMGKDIDPEVEGIYDDRVNQIYKDLAPALGMSPIRTKAAMEKIITSETTNPAIGLLYSGYDVAFKDDTTVGKEITGAKDQLFSNISRKLKRTTNKNLISYKEKAKAQEEKMKIETDIYKKEQEVYNEIRNNKDITKKEISDIIKNKFDKVDRKKYYKKYVTYSRKRDIDKSILNILYEDTPEVQALYLFNKFGDSFDSEEKEMMKTVMKAARRKISNKAMYIYNQKYKKK